ncbi:MAG: hypothetical protein OHK0052_16840 [Anaerolineales bacterium]
MWKHYFTAHTLDHALNLLNEYGARARIIAGATDLMLELERGQRPNVDTMIDISRLPELAQITLDEDGMLHLGALVTHNHCATSPLVRAHALPLAQAAWEVGAPQIRNRGTVAGNVITASPANDTITPLMALNACVRLRSVHGERVIPLNEFYTGVRKTVMQPDEILVEIVVPQQLPEQRGVFVKLGLRKAQAISVVNAAVILALAADGRVQHAAITLGAVAPTIVHARKAETYLIGRSLSQAVIEQAARLAQNAATPIDDVRASAGYRREMVRVCVAQGLRALNGEAEVATIPEKPVNLWGATDFWLPNRLTEAAQHPGQVIHTTINGKAYSFSSGFDQSLLHLLREQAGLIGSKEGCAEGECGACTVFLDGAAVMACLVPAPRAHGAEITTVEGLAQGEVLHPVQQAFVEHGAVQCGYCTPGFLMSAVKLLEEVPQPTELQIKHALTGNLCRCTGYYKIIEAVHAAAEEQVYAADE